VKKFNWRDFTEIFGIASIVGSLIFVGLQLNQSQEIAIASQYQERASTAVEYYASQMQSEQAVAEKALEATMLNERQGHGELVMQLMPGRDAQMAYSVLVC